MTMFLGLQTLVARAQTKIRKGLLLLSHFQFYVMYLCFPWLFCAWLAGSIDLPQPQEGIDGGSLPPGTEYAETGAGSSSLKYAALHSVHHTSA